jgi:hypothetical protein
MEYLLWHVPFLFYLDWVFPAVGSGDFGSPGRARLRWPGLQVDRESIYGPFGAHVFSVWTNSNLPIIQQIWHERGAKGRSIYPKNGTVKFYFIFSSNDLKLNPWHHHPSQKKKEDKPSRSETCFFSLEKAAAQSGVPHIYPYPFAC